jgi:hypothetical protein
MSAALLTSKTQATHDRLTRDCGIFHGVLFGFSVVCVLMVSVVMGGLAATGRIEKEVAGRWVASTTSMWAILLTLYLIYLHCIFYRNPLEQRCIVRILIMVIIYAVDSFCALLWHEQAVWIGAVRDSYEAYVIFSFFTLLMTFLDGPETVVQRYWQGGTATMKHLFPLCCFKPVTLDRSTLLSWEFMTLQYAVINPILGIVTTIIWFANRELYEEGKMDVHNSYPWIAGIRFISVTLAFTSLVYFFVATKDFMAEKSPTKMLISIKIIIFLSFWESVALSGLAHFGVIAPTKFWSSDSIATGATNFLLCVQMWMVAVAHRWCFSHEPYAALEPTDQEDVDEDGNINWCVRWAVIKDIFFCSDAAEQMRTIVGGVGQEVKSGIVQGVSKIGEGAAKIGGKIVTVFKRDEDSSKKLQSPASASAANSAALLETQQTGAAAAPAAASSAVAVAVAADVDEQRHET